MPGSLTRDAFSGPPVPPIEGGWGGGEGNPEGRGSYRGASFTGLFVLLVATTMLFAAFTSAMVVRRGVSGDWVSLHKPPILWINTLVLLASSATLEGARRALRARARTQFNIWWTLATLLGMAFLGGQALAWQQLRAAGVFLNTNPSGAFFFILTAAHAAHLLGGLAALVYVDFQAWRLRLGPAKRTAVDVSALFWHFLDLLWLYLMLLFFVWG